MDTDVVVFNLQSEDYQLLLEGKLDLGTPDMLKKQNISALFSKSMLLVRMMSTINASSIDWIDVKKHMGSVTINATRWGEVFDEIIMEFVLS